MVNCLRFRCRFIKSIFNILHSRPNFGDIFLVTNVGVGMMRVLIVLDGHDTKVTLETMHLPSSSLFSDGMYPNGSQT